MKYTYDQLQPIIESSLSFAEVARKLGKSVRGGNVTFLRKTAERLGIDTNHMTGQAHKKGKPSFQKRPLDEWLVLKEPTSNRTYARYLRPALIAAGVPYTCSLCPQGPMHNDKPLTLQVDHVNGLHYDNRLENLRFLCPNCHTQTDNFGVKNIK